MAGITRYEVIRRAFGAHVPPHDDDLVAVVDDIDQTLPGSGTALMQPWRILIADDDPSVHEATLAALAGQRLHQRTLTFEHTYSAAETLSLLAEKRDIHLVLLDVVMESPDAGLRAVSDIRDRLGLQELKIIIRTGQPGHAMEQEIRREYAIDGYTKKAELTRSLLRDVIASVLAPSGSNPPPTTGAH